MILTTDFRQLLALPCNPLVLACGCFDLLTVGHVRHLKAAKQMGKSLCVLVTADRHVNKPGRPIVPESQRVEVVDALGCVDYTIMNPYPTAVEAIRSLRPQVYVKGREYRGHHTPTLQQEIAEAVRVDCALCFTETDEEHTTDVIDKLLKRSANRMLKPCRGWIGADGKDPCNLCGWEAEAHAKYP